MFNFGKKEIKWLDVFLSNLKEMDNKSQFFVCVDSKNSKMKCKFLIARNRSIVEVFDLWENATNMMLVKKAMNNINKIIPKDETKSISCEWSSHMYWELIVWGSKIPTKIWRAY